MNGHDRLAWRSLVSLILVCVLVFVASPFGSTTPQNVASAATSGRTTPYLQNGSFENGLTNWTSSAARVNLGVTTLGGCLTVDTVDYADIWSRSSDYGTVPVWVSSKGPKPTNDNDGGTFGSFSVTNAATAPKSATFGGGTLAPAEGTSLVKLTLGSASGANYHVAHGPAIVSDTFRGILNQVITLNWYGTTGQDDFAVFGYLLDTDANNDGVASGTVADCVQYVLLDTTGSEVGNWQYADVTIPATKDFYKFVFVGGTFDKTGGGASGASFYVDNISQGTPQTVTFDLSGVTANYASGNITAPFQLPGSASSGMAVSYVSSTTSKCTVTSAGMLTVIAAGVCTITATQSGGELDGTLYASSPSVTQSFTITAIAATAQTITFAALTDRMSTAADFDLSATATSGMAVTFTSSTPSVCTVTGVTVSLVAAGTCTIVAAQAGGVNSGTNYAVAPTVTRSFLSQGSQTITFGALSDKDPTAADFAVSATSSAGLTVSYSTTSTGVCSVTSGGTVSILGPGTCTISAAQAGGATGGITYAAATAVTQSFTVRTAQTITFAAPAPVNQNAANFSLAATASSTLPVTFTSSTPSVCTVTSGGTVTMVSFGTCTITAAQSGGVSGGTSYAAAPSVIQSFTSRSLQTITFSALSDKDPTAADFAVSATTTSGLPITYSTTSTGVCSVTSAGTVSILGAGTCTISASQAGGLSGGITYAAATAVSQTFTVRTGQIVTFATPADRAEDAANFTLAATSSVGLTVSYVSNSPSVCTVTSAGVVSIVGFGTCSITASAPAGTVGGVSYAAAPNVTRTFVIKKKQTITFAAPADRLYNVADFNLTVSASSTLPVILTSSTPSVCTVSGVSVNLIAPGTCTISAAQAGGMSGGTDFAAAPTVTHSFSSNAVPQTVSMPTIPESHEYQGGLDMVGTTTSGLEITYTSTTPTVCTVTGKRVTFVGIGKCSIKGSQAGGTRGGIIYGASPDLTREFFVTNYTATPTVTPTNTRTFTPTMTPTPIPFLMKKGAVGASFVLGLLQNGTLITWGMNREFQANIPPCCGSAIDDVAVGTNFALALKGGRVFGWGANTKGQLRFPATTARNITAIAAGGAHGLALNKTGQVVSWGDNGFKQAAVPKGLKDVTQIAGGTNHSLVLTSAGRVVAWGSNASSQSKPPATLNNVIQVAGGLDHSLALRRDGTVVAWGGNAFGQASVPATAINVKQVSAGNQFSLVVQNDGTVFGWGRNDNNVYVIPPEYTDIYTVAAGYANTILGLRNGRVVVIGDQTNGIDASRTPTKTATPTP